MTEREKISFELKTKLVENELYIRLTDFENVMKKILNAEQENEQLKRKIGVMQSCHFNGCIGCDDKKCEVEE